MVDDERYESVQNQARQMQRLNEECHVVMVEQRSIIMHLRAVNAELVTMVKEMIAKVEGAQDGP